MTTPSSSRAARFAAFSLGVALVAAPSATAAPAVPGSAPVLTHGVGLTPPVTPTATATARAKLKVTIKRTSGYRLQTGTRSTFTGTAPRKTFKGNKVTLQRKVGNGAWVNVASAKVSSKGTYSVSGITTGVGVNSWRTFGVVPKTKKKKAYNVVSPVQAMWSLQWFYLYDLGRVNSYGWSHASTSIAGRAFSRSVGSYYDRRSGWGEYNLGYKCDEFRAEIGLRDDSETGAVRRFVASLDGAETSLGDKGLGSVTSVRIDTRTRFRLRLDVVDVSNPDGWGYYGNARILCQSKP
ncbi:hypothetical protein [Nocardioides yefusunii]|uniref:Glycosyl hydrolase family 98 putative carbohydrate-binding module domain-containing protein n=1 Tax=Nocardioides yefusunii TaxID=2500546 RepID=A0ABW1R3B7_9ACTN|nr:hypothetical protein [Nocardioides yefusunii]